MILGYCHAFYIVGKLCKVSLPLTTARERKLSGSGVRQLGQAQRLPQPKQGGVVQVLSPGSEMESAFAEALVSSMTYNRFRFLKTP